MVQRIEQWADYKIGAGNYQTFMFKVNNTQNGFRITLNASVNEAGMDLIYTLCPYADFEKFRDWKKSPFEYKRDASGNMIKNPSGIPITIPRQAPLINKIIERRTNILEKTLSLDPGVYALIFDNSYSAINAKSVWLHMIEEWDIETPTSNLPIIEQMLDNVPDDVVTCIMDANDCYTTGHFNQCSVMLRKAVEVAIKIKLQQSEIPSKQLLDKNGNELGLSVKIKLLRKKRLITQRSVTDLDQVKWFGDISAHSTMRVTSQDIRDNVEPKIRSFLVGLNLKP